MKLFVAGLPADFDDTDLKEMFELYGEISSAKVVVDRATGKSKGFGFVEMVDDNDAKLTIETLHGAKMARGKQMTVQQAEEGGGQRSRNSFGGGGGGFRRDDRGPRRDGGGGGGFRRDDRPKRY